MFELIILLLTALPVNSRFLAESAPAQTIKENQGEPLPIENKRELDDEIEKDNDELKPEITFPFIKEIGSSKLLLFLYISGNHEVYCRKTVLHS